MRVSKAPQQRRKELMAAARRLFDEKGVERTRVSDIVKRVGVAQGVFYYYFSSKEEMVQAVVQQVGDETTAAAGAILLAENLCFSQKLARLIELYISLIDQFLGDDETSILPLQCSGGAKTSLAEQSAGQLNLCLQKLVEDGAQTGEVAATFPWESAQVLLFGLRCFAEQALPSRKMVYTIIEETLGMEKNTLVQWAEKA